MRAVLAKDNVPVKYTKKTRWTVLGVEWCAPMFRKIVKLSKSSFRRCTKDILNGQLVWEPQLVLPKRLSHKDRPQRAHVAAWLRWVYDRLATNFAEVREKLDRDTGGLPMEDLAQEGIGESAIEPFNPLALASASLADLRKRPKYIPPGGPTELYAIYESACSRAHHANKASCRTFHREFKQWDQILLFQTIGKHATCTMCARYLELRKQSRTKEQRDAISTNQAKHLMLIMADFDVVTFFDRLAVESARPKSLHETGPLSDSTVVFLRIDGLDQAKCKCPRELAMSKEFETAWRPQLHIVCVLLSGIVECYYILEPDMYADSNMEMTLILRTIDVAVPIMNKRGLRLGVHLVILADNTDKEMRNQYSYGLCAYLTAKKHFRSVSAVHQTVGHTHGKQDQRLSILVEGCSHHRSLHTPEAFCNCVEKTMGPVAARSGCELHVEVVPGLWDCQQWLQPLNCGVGGVAITEQGQDVNHFFRWVLRKDLVLYRVRHQLFEWKVENVRPDWDAYPEHEEDIILLTKHFMSSDRLSQVPQLYLPQCHLSNMLSDAPSQALPRKTFDHRTARELQKTAERIVSIPWELHEASEWLMNLVRRNALGNWPRPCNIDFLHQLTLECSPMLPHQFLEWYDYAPGTPKAVFARKAPTAASLARRRLTGKQRVAGALIA